MKIKKIIALNLDGENLIRVPDYPKYWCNIQTGDLWSTHSGKPKKLNLSKDKDGYYKCSLFEKGKKTKWTLAHRVVTACVRGEWNFESEQIDHRNMVKDFNNYLNLSVVTREQQFTPEMKRRMSEGKKLENRLPEEVIREIRLGYMQFEKGSREKRIYIEAMAERHQKRYVIIHDICTGRTYKKIAV